MQKLYGSNSNYEEPEEQEEVEPEETVGVLPAEKQLLLRLNQSIKQQEHNNNEQEDTDKKKKDIQKITADLSNVDFD